VNSSQSPAESKINDKITDLVLEYALHPPEERPLRPELSLREEIGLDSFALVSLMLRIGEEFSVDLAEESSRAGINLQEISTFGDLLKLGQTFAAPRAT
jgi:acyl carrier protein